jgi:hypothetical protein
MNYLTGQIHALIKDRSLLSQRSSNGVFSENKNIFIEMLCFQLDKNIVSSSIHNLYLNNMTK